MNFEQELCTVGDDPGNDFKCELCTGGDPGNHFQCVLCTGGDPGKVFECVLCTGVDPAMILNACCAQVVTPAMISDVSCAALQALPFTVYAKALAGGRSSSISHHRPLCILADDDDTPDPESVRCALCT